MNHEPLATATVTVLLWQNYMGRWRAAAKDPTADRDVALPVNSYSKNVEDIKLAVLTRYYPRGITVTWELREGRL